MLFTNTGMVFMISHATRKCCKGGGWMRYNMKAERSRKGLSAKDVAKNIGVHENALLRWESGEAEPLGSNLIALSEFYGCSPEYLLELTDERTINGME